MTKTITWHAAVTFAGVPVGQPTDQQADALVGAGGAGQFATVTIHDEILRLEFTVDATTLNAATESALRHARAAYAAAYGRQGQPTGLRIVTDKQRVAELSRPERIELAGITEIGEVLDVSKQRAKQLTEKKDFPAPVDVLAGGAVYLRDSVEWFAKNRDTTPGRPRKAA